MTLLNLASGVCAGLAAAAWAVVAFTNVPKREITADMTNFNWLTEPLARQGRWNAVGAACAAVAAALQVTSSLHP